MPITITLRQILSAKPCYDPIARYGLEGMDRDMPISFREIVERAGARDAIWCFATALPGHEALKRHFAVDCAERVRHLMDDPRSLDALEVARRHALGQATNEELTAARAAAWDAWDAWDAAGAAARAAWDAWDAAGAAAGAAWDAAGAAARAAWAAWAAGVAVWDATWGAARAAVWAAWDAVWDAEREWQAARLIELTEGEAP